MGPYKQIADDATKWLKKFLVTMVTKVRNVRIVIFATMVMKVTNILLVVLVTRMHLKCLVLLKFHALFSPLIIIIIVVVLHVMYPVTY